MNYDLTRPTRTEVCRDGIEEFCDNPVERTFSALWTPDALHTAANWNESVVLNLWAGELQELASFFDEIRAADEFEYRWCDRFPIHAAVWEIYARTHEEVSFLPSEVANAALDRLNHEPGSTYHETLDAIDSFAEAYRDEIGRVTEDFDEPVPFRDELDEFFRLVATVTRDDFAAEVKGPQGDLYRSLYGYEGAASGDQSGPITIHRDSVWPAIEGHVDARERGAYDDHHETSHWGGTHIETWKWDFAEYVEAEIRSTFELAKLDPSDVEPFLEKWNASTNAYGGRISQETPKKMMSRYGKDKYTYACEYCRENPEEAAVAFSTLFDQERHVETRLEEFDSFMPDEIISAGSKVRFVSSFLMFVYPQEFITFQYKRFNHFFTDHTAVSELETGYDPREYYRVVLACRMVRDWLDEVLDDASMLDVHTLIWVYYDY